MARASEFAPSTSMQLERKFKEEREVFTLSTRASEFAPSLPMELSGKSKEEREVFPLRA